MSEAPDRRAETRHLLAREQWGARGETWEDKATLQVELIDSGPDRGKVQIAVLSERHRGGRGAAGTVHWDQAAIRLREEEVRRLRDALSRVLTQAHLARDTDAQLEAARKRVEEVPKDLPSCPLGAYEKLKFLGYGR